jgi:hypothetical protein
MSIDTEELAGSNSVEQLSGSEDSVIQCMFWCMFASDVTAIYCDILQNRMARRSFILCRLCESVR